MFNPEIARHEGYICNPDPSKPATVIILNGRVHFSDMMRSLWASEHRENLSWHKMWQCKIPSEIAEYQRLKL